MNKRVFYLAIFLVFINCRNPLSDTGNYTIESLMSNNRSSGGYFSKDASKLLYSSNKTGVFNIYEVDLFTKTEIQKTNSEKESYFVQGYSPLTNEIIYSADKGGNENSHL
jgi:Tol biopolymer transport system component